MHLTIEQLPSKLRGTIWDSLIAPRPIALISTQDVPNVAPYNAFCGHDALHIVSGNKNWIRVEE